MKRLPNINQVVSSVLSSAGQAQQEKIASEVQPPKDYTSDVALSIKKLAQHLRASSSSVSYDDVFSLGNKLLRGSR
jgi:hypothetical protein